MSKVNISHQVGVSVFHLVVDSSTGSCAIRSRTVGSLVGRQSG